MSSIRRRLITILIGTTGLVWLSAVVWIYFSTQAEVNRVLDARLIEAARMVNSLLTDHRIEIAVAEGLSQHAPGGTGSGQQEYDRQLSCQIWSLGGALVGRSAGAPEAPLTKTEVGFSENKVDDERWRVYTVENAQLGVRVMVGDSLRIRDRLVGDVIKGLLLPAALILPFLIGMIWLSVRRGLSPLSDLAVALSRRAASDLRPLPDTNMPKEIAPAIKALNGLFRRVDAARERERSFTAFAAHELKTPLAGLKTQAQIALGSNDPEVHANALRQISTGVDRTGRLVKQLLDLAILEADDLDHSPARESVASLVKAAVADLRFLASSGRVTVEIEADGSIIGAEVDPHFFMLALRNLLENAIIHSPSGGKVTCRVRQGGGEVVVEVEDDGPGIPDAELPHATEKFFRGWNKSPAGSGLGLAIARIAVSRMGGLLRIENRTPRGLKAVLGFSAMDRA